MGKRTKTLKALWGSLTAAFTRVTTKNKPTKAPASVLPDSTSVALLLDQNQDSRYPSLPITPSNSQALPNVVNLPLAREKHRLRMLALGQPHTSLPSPLIRIRRHPTGDQMSLTMTPPEARGTDLLKWLLVMESLFPNRSKYLTSYSLLREARPHLQHKPKTEDRPGSSLRERYMAYTSTSATFVPLRRVKSCVPAPTCMPSFPRLCETPPNHPSPPQPDLASLVPVSASVPNMSSTRPSLTRRMPTHPPPNHRPARRPVQPPLVPVLFASVPRPVLPTRPKVNYIPARDNPGDIIVAF